MAVTMLRATVDEHRRRLLEGEEARRGLREWSERVLSRVNNEALTQSAAFDADQHDVDLETIERLAVRGPDGVGAQLVAYWNQTVEERVRERLDEVKCVAADEVARIIAVGKGTVVGRGDITRRRVDIAARSARKTGKRDARGREDDRRT